MAVRTGVVHGVHAPPAVMAPEAVPADVGAQLQSVVDDPCPSCPVSSSSVRGGALMRVRCPIRPVL